MTKKEMIKLINKKLDVYFYDWEVKKVLDLCHKIYNDGQAETIAMLKHHNEEDKIKREYV
jgi:3-oxoacyl-[acyl-carrier-protein] synthase III